MFRLEILFLMQAAMGILMIVFLQKMIQIKKQIEDIVKEVKEYITFITEETEEQSQSEISNLSSCAFESTQTSKNRVTIKKEDKEEAQTRLIQAVLGEYFP